MKKRKIFSIFLVAVLTLASGFLYDLSKTHVESVHAVENQSVQSAPYYGRSALASMSDANVLLYAYDAIVDCVLNSEESASVYDGTNPISAQQLSIAVDAYRRDYTEHFWFGNQYGYSYNSNTVLSFKPTYIMSGNALEDAKAEFNEEVEQILAQVDLSANEFEKELFLHDLLARRITYVEGENAHDSYGAIVKGEAVCEGYAESFQYLLRRVGIQSFIITGSSVNPSTGLAEGHAWNAVKIDGSFYQVDLTWNDQGANIYHAYYNVTDAQIQEDHLVESTYYPLPVCNATEKEYFNVKGGKLDSYTVQGIASLLKDNEYVINVKVQNPTEFLSFFTTNVQSIAQSANVKGSFSYGYSVLGKEVRVYITTSSSHTHNPSSTLTFDQHTHWYTCNGCEEKISEQNHVYSSSCDTRCNVCNFTREIEHNFSSDFEYDENSHYKICACGEKNDVAEHVDLDENGTCDFCAYSMPSAPLTPEPDDNQGENTPDDNQGESDLDNDKGEGNDVIAMILELLSSCTGDKEGSKYALVVYGAFVALAFVFKR